MESPKAQQEIAGRLTFTETQRIKTISKQLENLVEHPEITKERFDDITNALSELTAVREIYLTRLLNLYRRGFILD